MTPPCQLPAGDQVAPPWERAADVVVVGSGVAGLTAALAASGAGRRVLVVTKGELGEGCTAWAQGGIAAALGPQDSPERHLADTVAAGGDLCDPAAVRALVERGPGAVRGLIRRGARFDPPGPDAIDPPGLALTREGGHTHPRIVHAGGDATGREVSRVLSSALREAPGVEVAEHAFVLDALRGPGGTTVGVRVASLNSDGTVAGVGLLHAPAVVLATGGAGQMYATTSNPDVATGDGQALALRAGAELADMEFVQFHPTVLFTAHRDRPDERRDRPPRPARGHGRALLVSEAMRGEGATLLDATGARVMAGEHPLEDLAPRDVVARAVATRMAQGRGGVGDHVYLDARALGESTLLRRFPTIVAECRSAGIDPVVEPIPVAPAAHYTCGGVRVDPCGRTSVPGLYAVGEVACTGVHGANRLASNSLLEGLVMGEVVSDELGGAATGRPEGVAVAGTREPATPAGATSLVDPGARAEIAATMSRCAGVLRDAGGLAQAGEVLRSLPGAGRGEGAPGRATWEVTNLATVAAALVAAASAREESRGCHVRGDHPRPDPAWRRHLVLAMRPDGTLDCRVAESAAIGPAEAA